MLKEFIAVVSAEYGTTARINSELTLCAFSHMCSQQSKCFLNQFHRGIMFRGTIRALSEGRWYCGTARVGMGRYCTSTAQVLLRYCSGTAQVLQVLQVLHRYCSGTAQVLPEPSTQVLHRYCSKSTLSLQLSDSIRSLSPPTSPWHHGLPQVAGLANRGATIPREAFPSSSK